MNITPFPFVCLGESESSRQCYEAGTVVQTNDVKDLFSGDPVVFTICYRSNGEGGNVRLDKGNRGVKGV